MTLDEFKKVELRVGKIISAERVPGSEKLIKLSVDLGEKGEANLPAVRQIVSGIGKAYEPEALMGREVVIVANLDPRMMMGLESQGMLLAAHDESGGPILLVPERSAPPGSEVG